jgi:hypothetical protein
MYDELVRLVNTVGFPIAVSIFLLSKVNDEIDELRHLQKNNKST